MTWDTLLYLDTNWYLNWHQLGTPTECKSDVFTCIISTSQGSFEENKMNDRNNFHNQNII